MTHAEVQLEWIVAHRGEPQCDLYLRKLAKKMDAKVVKETLSHITGGYYVPDDPEGFADSAENPKEVFAKQICKQCYAAKRERKLADNKEHLRKLAEKRSVV